MHMTVHTKNRTRCALIAPSIRLFVSRMLATLLEAESSFPLSCTLKLHGPSAGGLLKRFMPLPTQSSSCAENGNPSPYCSMLCQPRSRAAVVPPQRGPCMQHARERRPHPASITSQAHSPVCQITHHCGQGSFETKKPLF
jgi:hypothetical protein